MKELGKKENVKKGIYTLLLAAVLFGSSFSAIAHTPGDVSKQNSNLDTLSYASRESQALSAGYVDLLDENFTDGNMPPKGVWGDWELKPTNNQTWYIDSTTPRTTPYCGTIRRNGSQTLQDEWLITPSLNFSQYPTEIYLEFYWYTCYYVTVYKKYVEFNISVSIDGGTNWTKIWRFNNIGQFFFHIR
jgi:hypothetical protein